MQGLELFHARLLRGPADGKTFGFVGFGDLQGNELVRENDGIDTDDGGKGEMIIIKVTGSCMYMYVPHGSEPKEEQQVGD